MDMTYIKEFAPYRWQPVSSPHPITLCGSKELIASMDEMVLEQITHVAQLPGIVGPAFAMPDAHWGYGFPIGGVAAFDPEQGGIISAGGVGFDISCGIRCLRTNLSVLDVLAHIEPLADALFQAVPSGVGEESAIRLTLSEIDHMLEGGAKWAVAQGYGEGADLDYIEEQGCMRGAMPEYVSLHAKKRQVGEMGTLGSGNHYLEVEVVDKIYDGAAAADFGIAEGQILVAIHCGSRGLGHQIGSDYLVMLAKAAKRLGMSLPHRELACAPIQSDEGRQYLGAMCAGINCALANRQIITHFTREVFARYFPKVDITTLYDVSHNTCKKEQHVIDKVTRELYIHRKGATRAFPPGHSDVPARYRASGQPVFIGGSMGTGSYLLAGNPMEENQAFASASHGAGRTMSRHQALKQWRGKALLEELARKGIYIRTGTLRGAAEEAPGAYKDVDLVAAVTEGCGLARRVAYLRPLACVKG